MAEHVDDIPFSYANLSQFVTQFADPIKRLSEEFSRSHMRTLEEAIRSLATPYQRKSAYVEPQWKNADFLSLLVEHKEMMFPPHFFHSHFRTLKTRARMITSKEF